MRHPIGNIHTPFILLWSLPWFHNALIIILYRQFFIRWLSRVHVPPITFEHIDTLALQSLFVLLLKPFVFVCWSFVCLVMWLLIWVSSVAIDLLGVWRVELTGPWERRTSPNGKGKLHFDHTSTYIFYYACSKLSLYACVGLYISYDLNLVG